jgi:ADP-ribose pyrophosphatase
MTPRITPIESRRVYTGRIFDVAVDRVRFPDGSDGELEIIRHPGAAAVVPIASPIETTDDPTVLMLRQFRYAADGDLWEIPAGRLAPGESPAECAQRELLEEAGVEAERLDHLTSIYTTPGFTDEHIHLFAAFGLQPREPNRDPDEFIEVSPMPLSQILERIRTGEICDGKTIAAVLFLAGFRLGL